MPAPLTAPDSAPDATVGTNSPDPAHESRPVLIWQGQHWEARHDAVSREVPILLRLPDGLRTLWAWPHDLDNLVRGHLLLDCRPEMTSATPDARPAAQPPSAPDAPIWLLRRLDDSRLDESIQDETRSSAEAHGIPCYEARPLRADRPLPEGALRVPSAHSAYARPILPCVPNEHSAYPCPTSPCAHSPLRPQSLIELMERFLALAGPWDATGCFHRLALWRLDAPDQICRVAEDIGRHNCLDRLAGWLDREGLAPADFGLLLSARITASLYAKARRAGVAVLVSRAAVSSAAVDAAHADGVTLIGFCRPREGRLTVFADPARRLDLAVESGMQAPFWGAEPFRGAEPNPHSARPCPTANSITRDACPTTHSDAARPCPNADSFSGTACSYACSDICSSPTMNSTPATTPSFDAPPPAFPNASPGTSPETLPASPSTPPSTPSPPSPGTPPSAPETSPASTHPSASSSPGASA